MALVTIAQVNMALRLGLDLGAATGERYDDIVMKIEQAQDIVLDFVTVTEKTDWDVDDNTHPVPPRVASAVILTVRALLDDSPDGSSAAWLSGLSNTIPANIANPIASLLWRLRDPTLA